MELVPNMNENACRQKIIDMLWETMQDTLTVFDFGAVKHPDSGDIPNFLTEDGNKCSLKERGSSVLRHAARTFMYPEMKDEESNLPELLHLMASVSILYIRQKRKIIHSDDAVSEK
jgi:hypothetical protein